jgi:hypothetical protein
LGPCRSTLFPIQRPAPCLCVFNAKFIISDSTYTKEKTKESDKKKEIKNRREEDKREEKVCIEIAKT